RVFGGNPAEHQARPGGERLEVASILDARPEDGKLRGLRAGFDDGRGRRQLVVIDVTELSACYAKRDKLAPHRRDDLASVGLLGQPLVRLESKHAAGQALGVRRVDQQGDRVTAPDVELGNSVWL